ncbi:hypothetical protein, partial [Hydrogenispora ethanolica]|uniref:hypothetical protein n=1 Tax=Hydrogenispora ethanolica TaxID=1082276 RepID=UPI001A9D581D
LYHKSLEITAVEQYFQGFYSALLFNGLFQWPLIDRVIFLRRELSGGTIRRFSKKHGIDA